MGDGDGGGASEMMHHMLLLWFKRFIFESINFIPSATLYDNFIPSATLYDNFNKHVTHCRTTFPH